MGNEVAVMSNGGAGVTPFGAGAEGFETAQRIGKALASSTLVPEAYRGNLPNVLVAMELAHRIGASVFAVMQNMDVVHGRPSLRSTFLIATVNASGRFTPLRWRFQGEEGTDGWGCRTVAIERESGEECLGPLVTIATAKAEQWYARNGSKWKTIPELMLMYRSAGWWTRVYCPEMSLGMRTSDEYEDMALPTQERSRSAAAALDAADEIPAADFEVTAPAAAAAAPPPEREPGADDEPPEPGEDMFAQAESKARSRAKAAQEGR